MAKRKKVSTKKIINDTRIIAILRQNGRKRIADISKETNIPLNEIHNFIRSNSYIKKHTAIVDFGKLGYNIKLVLALAVSSLQKDEIETYLGKSLHANFIYKINNGYDFMVELIFKSMDESNRFIENLDRRFLIYDKKEYYILETKKEQLFMTNHNLVF